MYIKYHSLLPETTVVQILLRVHSLDLQIMGAVHSLYDSYVHAWQNH